MRLSSAKRMFLRATATPWAVKSEVSRLITHPAVAAILRLRGVQLASGIRFYGMPMVQRWRGSRIELGPGVQLRSTRLSNPLAPNHSVVLATRSAGARISIGEQSGLTGTTIVAEHAVDIGARVSIGANVTIVDTDFHPLTPQLRNNHPNAGIAIPVVLEDDVFVGMNSLILKGVHIGQGSVIGAGSVVTRDIPAGVVAAGNPARIIRYLDRERRPAAAASVVPRT